ncbi:MAG: hypothetical protein MJ168_10655 [Clostridia bacterium]|nr:hypothetical protein [Clostridia bacterium]
MEQFVIDQITSGLKYLPSCLAKSFFIPDSSEQTEKMRKNFICGVCHPRGEYRKITDANIDWIRTDIPFPFNDDGTINPSYVEYKKKALEFKVNGINVMAVTPYPKDYIAYGADIRRGGGETKIREIARFLIRDLQGVVSGLQITNEMGMPRFTKPLNMNEAAKFIGIQLKEMYYLRGDIVIGYNSAGPQADLHSLMKPYFQYCDYVGIDIYLGCFYGAPGFMWMFDALVRYLWAMTGKPVVLQEFGYISGGHTKTRRQRNELLQRYGAKNKKDAKKNIVKFVDNLPKTLSEHTKYICDENAERYFNFLFKSDMRDHLYCELQRITKIPGYDHTAEGQGKFYTDIIKRLYDMKCVAGMIIYCYQDPEHCYVCGQADCPVETKWGLVDAQGNPKPSYYAVQKEFGKIKGENNV